MDPMCLEWNNSEPQGRSSWQIWKNTYWSHKCWMRWIWSASWPMACRHHHTMGRIGSLTKKLRVFSALDTCGESTGIHMVHAFTCSSPAWLQDCLWAPCCGKAIPLFCCGMQWWGITKHFCSLLRNGMGMRVMMAMVFRLQGHLWFVMPWLM